MADVFAWLRNPRPNGGHQDLEPALVPVLDPDRGQDPALVLEEATRDAPSLGAVVALTHPRIAVLHAPEAGVQEGPDQGRLKRMVVTLRMEIAILDRVPDLDLGPEIGLDLPALRMTTTNFPFFFA